MAYLILDSLEAVEAFLQSSHRNSDYDRETVTVTAFDNNEVVITAVRVSEARTMRQLLGKGSRSGMLTIHNLGHVDSIATVGLLLEAAIMIIDDLLGEVDSRCISQEHVDGLRSNGAFMRDQARRDDFSLFGVEIGNNMISVANKLKPPCRNFNQLRTSLSLLKTSISEIMDRNIVLPVPVASSNSDHSAAPHHMEPLQPIPAASPPPVEEEIEPIGEKLEHITEDVENAKEEEVAAVDDKPIGINSLVPAPPALPLLDPAPIFKEEIVPLFVDEKEIATVDDKALGTKPLVPGPPAPPFVDPALEVESKVEEKTAAREFVLHIPKEEITPVLVEDEEVAAVDDKPLAINPLVSAPPAPHLVDPAPEPTGVVAEPVSEIAPVLGDA